jgi:cytochrome c oxidase assembly protein subunit 15
MSQLAHGRGFRRLAWITVGAVYFLILVGGIVRASGSGMGCPDWPRCFGRWIPPTSEAQLPDDYREIYAHRGYGEQPFNVLRTWTEYVNRLIGAAIGLLIFGVLVASFSYWRRDRRMIWWSLAAFVLVAVQGWLGSVVVASNLAPWMVTVHMLLALVIVGMLIYVLARSHEAPTIDLQLASRSMLGWTIVAALALSVLQVILGTQVREQIDQVALGSLERGAWVGELGGLVLVHRTLSLLLVAVIIWLWIEIRRASHPANRRNGLRRLADALVVIVGVEIVAGAVLFYFALPAALQPVHLLFGSLLVGLELAAAVVYRRATGNRAVVPL